MLGTMFAPKATDTPEGKAKTKNAESQDFSKFLDSIS